MQITINIANTHKELVAEAFKGISTGYPTDDSDEKIVTDALTAYVRSVVSQYQTIKLQEQAITDAQAIADKITLG